MQITIIGAGGVRTPLIIQAIAQRQEELGITDLVLMDINQERLDLLARVTQELESSPKNKFTVIRTTDPQLCLEGADYVITTFRVGDMQSRIHDERIPLQYNVLGQETTGPGGFSLGMRTIPVLLEYINLMKRCCPDAWLINFANPSGMLTEAIRSYLDWKKVVGICDAPASMQTVAASILQAPANQVLLDYFGLNHLGWVRGVKYAGVDYLPKFLQMIKTTNGLPELPFESKLLEDLQLIPNEYLYYYYYREQAVQHIIRSEMTRGEQIFQLNQDLYTNLRNIMDERYSTKVSTIYEKYLFGRWCTYMKTETGVGDERRELNPSIAQSLSGHGYAGVALDLIAALAGDIPKQIILNIENQGAIHGMEYHDVVEIPTYVSSGMIKPLAVGPIPSHCLGLMQQVKQYEQLTIQAALEKSYSKALLALTLHPLVGDRELAKKIVNDYLAVYKGIFPELR